MDDIYRTAHVTCTYTVALTAHVECIPWMIPITLHMLHVHTPERLLYHHIQYKYSTYCRTCIPWMMSIALHMSHVHTPERLVYHKLRYTYSTAALHMSNV